MSKYKVGQKLNVMVESIDSNGKAHFRVMNEDFSEDNFSVKNFIKALVQYEENGTAEASMSDEDIAADIIDLIDQGGFKSPVEQLDIPHSWVVNHGFDPKMEFSTEGWKILNAYEDDVIAKYNLGDIVRKYRELN